VLPTGEATLVAVVFAESTNLLTVPATEDVKGE
jgi:hypothetical protein